jgi:hypothetical protein
VLIDELTWEKPDGEQRGDCCATCNSGLGMLKDNPELAQRAAAYLEKHGHA